MALLNGPKPSGGPTLLGVPMKQASLITVRWLYWMILRLPGGVIG